MKKIFSVVLGGCLLLGACAATEQKTITIKGKVQFPDNQYNMEIVAEDEDLEINFRGMDTARIKIKNPPYVYINGGPNNEVMNLMNWDGYRGYQLMIGISQGVYRIQGLDDQAKQETSMKFYDAER